MEAATPTVQHAMKCPNLFGQECKCDGYHTFDELYDHRFTLFVALCRKIVSTKPEWTNGGVWRAKLHYDGTMFDGWFVMGIRTDPNHQITYHLPVSRWDETEFAYTLSKAPEWDGHTPDDVLSRLKEI